MKFKIIFFLFLVLSCSPQFSTINQKKLYAAKGFAYIYNDTDFKEKIIKGQMSNDKMEISHQNLKTGALIKIINPKNNKTIILKNIKRIAYPDFYKILISKPVAEKLSLDPNLPLLELIEVKKNKSFVAEKAIIYNEEKKISSNAPIESVQISNISKNKSKITTKITEEIFILVASFYSLEAANFLKQRIINEVIDLDIKKLSIKKINSKESQVILGPYNSVNLLKNDYIKLQNFGFEELNIFINE
jgi:hypothetical protein